MNKKFLISALTGIILAFLVWWFWLTPIINLSTQKEELRTNIIHLQQELDEIKSKDLGRFTAYTFAKVLDFKNTYSIMLLYEFDTKEESDYFRNFLENRE